MKEFLPRSNRQIVKINTLLVKVTVMLRNTVVNTLENEIIRKRVFFFPINNKKGNFPGNFSQKLITNFLSDIFSISITSNDMFYEFIFI